MSISANDLDDFVARSDRLGGPGTPACEELWAGFEYVPAFTVDQSLDPLGEAYVAQQMRLYEEVSGRCYDAPRDEQLAFEVERHIAAPNPYDHPAPAVLAMHLQRLSRSLRLAEPRRGETLLDMGCGWGLSSELAAYLGLHVVAVDINPSFVRLVNERARRDGRAILAVEATFEAFAPDEPGDIALFYECLHHAVRPWAVLGHIARCLKAGGRVVLAGEPINAVWWTHWGLRLDALSVYCIRKFGWFESGWSLPFIMRVLHRAGLVPTANPDPDPLIGSTIVAHKPARHRISGGLAGSLFGTAGCDVEKDYLLMTGEGTLDLLFPADAGHAELEILACHPAGLSASLHTRHGAVLFNGRLPSGHTTLRVPRSADTVQIRFDIERWVPDAVVGNGDLRTLGLHLAGIGFVPR